MWCGIVWIKVLWMDLFFVGLGIYLYCMVIYLILQFDVEGYLLVNWIVELMMDSYDEG